MKPEFEDDPWLWLIDNGGSSRLYVCRCGHLTPHQLPAVSDNVYAWYSGADTHGRWRQCGARRALEVHNHGYEPLNAPVQPGTWLGHDQQDNHAPFEFAYVHPAPSITRDLADVAVRLGGPAGLAAMRHPEGFSYHLAELWRLCLYRIWVRRQLWSGLEHKLTYNMMGPLRTITMADTVGVAGWAAWMVEQGHDRRI